MNNLQVIYIAGAGRSGTTLVDRLLGTLEGVCSCNELYRIWREGFGDNSICPCGAHFDRCAFWTAVVADLGWKSSDVRHFYELHNAVDHSRHFPRLYFGFQGPAFRRRLAEYREVLAALYGAIARRSGSHIIVDSSKVPSRALVLGGIPGIDVHVIHLVRDVRAITHAWAKAKHNPASGGHLDQYPAYRSAVFWTMRNVMSEMLGNRFPYVRVTYEHFARSPRSAMRAVVQQVAPLRGKELAFVSEDTIELGTLHSMSGNPHRFEVGEVQIRLDDAWRQALSPGVRRTLSILAHPWLVRYGLDGAPTATRTASRDTVHGA